MELDCNHHHHHRSQDGAAAGHCDRLASSRSCPAAAAGAEVDHTVSVDSSKGVDAEIGKDGDGVMWSRAAVLDPASRGLAFPMAILVAVRDAYPAAAGQVGPALGSVSPTVTDVDFVQRTWRF